MNMQSMKEMPKNQRPYERCMKNGPQILTDAELLSIILRTGTVGESSLELSQRLMQTLGTAGLAGLLEVTLPQLKTLKGVGTVKAIQLQCIGELSKRIAQSQRPLPPLMNNPAEIAAYYMEELRHRRCEVLYLLMLNSKNRLIKDTIVSQGTVDASIASAREIYITALSHQAVRIILLHNHPSGDCSPSADDLSTTYRLKAAGELIGIELLDHIIIGDCCYYSLREWGLMNEVETKFSKKY